MKKVLFLAIAALAYAGSANAQTAVASLATVPVADITLVTANTTPIATVRMTNGGNYTFSATGTKWSTVLGPSWNDVLGGSVLSMKLGAAAADLSGAGVAADEPTLSKTYSIITNTTLAFTEIMYDKTPAVIGSACSDNYSISLNVQAKPVVDLAMTNKTYCASATNVITLDLGFNNVTDAHYIKGKVTNKSTSTDVVTDGYYSFAANTTSWDLGTVAATAGTYTVTVSEVYDAVSVEAANASALSTITNGTLNFVVLPKPAPTLKTSTIQ